MRKKMIEGITNMEKDAMDGRRVYASGIWIAGSEEDTKNERQIGKPLAKKRAKRTNNTQDNNKRTASGTCKCGRWDHKRVSSKVCPWRGIDKKKITEREVWKDRRWKIEIVQILWTILLRQIREQICVWVSKKLYSWLASFGKTVV
jgi:hypothetical protein